MIRYFQKELFSLFLPSPYAGHVGPAAASCHLKWKDGSTVELIIFVFKISFLCKYRVKYYEYIVNWYS